MNSDELRNRIKYLRDVERLTSRQIAQELGISRGRCLRICSGKSGADKIPALSFLEPYRSLVGEWYATHPNLKASQIWQRLLARGVQTSYTSVKRLTRPFRKKKDSELLATNFCRRGRSASRLVYGQPPSFRAAGWICADFELFPLSLRQDLSTSKL